MFISYVKHLLEYFYYKMMYPNANIAFLSRVSSDCILGGDLVIGHSSSVVASSIGNKLKIENNTHICDSTLDNTIKIGSNSSVYNSIIGDNAIISNDCYISNTKLSSNTIVSNHSYLKEVEIGSFSYISQNSFILNTKIGNFCSLAPNLISGPGEHPSNFISTSPAFFFKNYEFTFSEKDYFEHNKEVCIGHDVWIGARVFLKNGVKIGNGSIIAAGAVVVKDVPDYAIVAGIPARLIRYRFTEEIISELLKIQWWNWSADKLQKSHHLFRNENISSFIEWSSHERSEKL